MATREQMANARDALPGHDQDRREATADAAAASAANVPWAPAGVPAGIVYLHGTERVADDGDADGWDGDDPADFDDDAPSKPAPSLLRRAIPLLWAAALTVAALQHAGEVERRAALQEPSSAELDMQDRAQREIRAAWRSVGAVAAVTERKPALVSAGENPILVLAEEPTAIVPEKKPAATAIEEKPILARVEEKPVDTIVAAKSEPTLAEGLSKRVTAEDTPSDRQKTEHALVEPITEAARVTTNSGTADGPAKDAERPARDEAVVAKGSHGEAKPDVAHFPPRPGTGEATKADQKGRIATSRASRHRVARAEPARPKHTRVSSSKYVAFDGHSPRYFTIERPSRMAP